MSFNVDNFTSSFKDLARSYQFKAIFSPPVGVFNPGEKITILVESTVLPTKTVAEVEANFMGQQVKLAGNISYENWTCTFRMDSSLDIYRTFREWMDVIRTSDGILRAPRDYKSFIELQQLDGNQDVKGTLIISGAFPITLGEITFDTKASDIQTFPVTFAYDFHNWNR